MREQLKILTDYAFRAVVSLVSNVRARRLGRATIVRRVASVRSPRFEFLSRRFERASFGWTGCAIFHFAE
eukprot:9853208-Lingulodinium_polyedra.AAC.1